MTRRIGIVVFLAVGLTGVAGLGTENAKAASAPPPTLSGEVFNNVSTGNSNTHACNTDQSGTFTFSASGTATGPYPGPYSEIGTAGVNNSDSTTAFSATFTVQSALGTVTGTKTSTTGSVGFCSSFFRQDAVGFDSYQATISTPNGTYEDRGTGTFFVGTTLTTPDSTSNDESFSSSLTQPILIAPSSKDQCKNGGYLNYPQFKNQGQCVAYVENGQQPSASMG